MLLNIIVGFLIPKITASIRFSLVISLSLLKPNCFILQRRFVLLTFIFKNVLPVLATPTLLNDILIEFISIRFIFYKFKFIFIISAHSLRYYR